MAAGGDGKSDIHQVDINGGGVSVDWGGRRRGGGGWRGWEG